MLFFIDLELLNVLRPTFYALTLLAKRGLMRMIDDDEVDFEEKSEDTR